MFASIVLKDGSVVSFVALVGQEKYCVFLICSQKKAPSFSLISQEKSGKNIMLDVYEPCMWRVREKSELNSKSR